MKNIYSIRALTHSYGKYQTLDIDELDIAEGGVVGLVGPNGSGKSTLLKILAFLLPPLSGELLWDGERTGGREHELRREATLLLQAPYLLRRSVYRNIAYGLKLRGISGEETEKRVCDSLSRVGLAPGDFANRPWFRLSGGEAQRVSLAVRLALRPRALLLDEPTANVDEASAACIKEAVASAWSDWGTTIIVATHDLAWLHEVATGIVGMYAGRAVRGTANLLRGNWRAEEPGGNTASLSIGETTFRACVGSGARGIACAAVDPSDISICRAYGQGKLPRAGDGLNLARGIVTQMALERSTGEILVAVDCKGTIFRVRITRNETTDLNICPGEPVILSFPVSSLKLL
jgi:tungstate transport system ATP-binding protein